MRKFDPSYLWIIFIACQVGNWTGFLITRQLGSSVGISIGIFIGMLLMYINSEKV